MMRDAAKIGPATIALIETVMKAKPLPEAVSEEPVLEHLTATS